MRYRLCILFLSVLIPASMMLACTPRVEVGIPDKPINININAKIDHEVRVKVERDVEELISDESDLF